MAEFDDLRRKLLDARVVHQDTRQAALRSGEQLARVERRLRELARSMRPGDERAARERRALEEEKRRLEGAKAEYQETLKRTRGELADVSTLFWRDWTDPRQNAGRMSDSTPVLLLPLRIETRFTTVSTRAGSTRQLWVRVYPDDCLIDTFEETLSETELDSATIFWREFFHAAGSEDAERAAWRALVASHGSGRAAWIAKAFRPLNPLEPGDPLGDPALELKPSSRAAGEVLLVASFPDGAATLVERAALGTYWAAVWKAQGAAAAEAAARTALNTSVGAARATELITRFRPYNLAEKPPATYTHATATARAVPVVLPARETIDTKGKSWTQPARADLLPERFVLLGYNGPTEVLNAIGAPVQTPFAVSPDPAADTESQFDFDEHGNLIVGDELRWMTDFDNAVERGMGFRVDLTPAQGEGFDRLFVLGIRLSADAAKGKSELETLFTHHYFSRAGFSFLPQGAATNNTEDGNSAYSREDDASASYDFVFKKKAQFTETDNVYEKRDGQWFAESLGLGTGWLKQVPNAGAEDQAEARAMNVALWPATLGYFMDTLLQPVFDDDQVYYTRWFFTHYVSGRGTIPAIRIGRQPYGVLPATAYSRTGWLSERGGAPHVAFIRGLQEVRSTGFQKWLNGFKSVLDGLHEIWSGLARAVPHVDARRGDPHQQLLHIVGLHPASVEFYQRYANTKEQEHNIAAMWQLFIPWATLPANELHNEAFDLLVRLGYGQPQVPLLFDLFWKVSANYLSGPVIQEGPLSETEALRAVTTNNRNYIEWLNEWARLSFDAVRLQDGFQNNVWPNALLYVLLKHALELGYHDAGVRVLEEAALVDTAATRALRAEPHFFHVAAERSATAGSDVQTATRSRYELLYSPNERITGDRTTLLVDHITSRIGHLFPARYLTEQLNALQFLTRTPTARLERLLAEHLDCCAYRLDAWMIGLVNMQLASMRQVRRRGENEEGGSAVTYREGIYIGAYGWLENVRPSGETLTPVRLSADLDEIFNQQQPEGQRAPLVTSDQNEGYIHAPSVNHAVTAAVLRNGYVAHATPEQPEVLKVNLSSERVRIALGFIEGIRNGQSLGALLGYQFERGLHDRYDFAECDQFIYPMRLAFPLYTKTEDLPEGVSIQSVQARNVVDGLRLIRHIRSAAPANKTYPFGFPDTKLPHADASQQAVINAEVTRLLDIHDALADMAVAEGVHQVVMGNYDRAAATLDAYSQATFPPTPDVVRTPRSGIALTERVGLHFEINVPVAASDGPRVKAEPAVNRWVASLLPPPARVGCTVTYLDPVTRSPHPRVVTQAELGLQPLDMLYMLRPDNLDARSELEDRVRDVVLRDAAIAVRPDLIREVAYGQGATADYSIVEVAPIVRSLRALLLHSRPLRATDVTLPTEAKADGDSGSVLDRTRVDFLPAALTGEKTTLLVPLQTQLDAVFPETGPDTAVIVTQIDHWLDAIVTACRTLARYGLAQTGFGAFHEGKAAFFTMVLKKATAVAERWQDRIDEYDALLLTLPTLTDEDERVALLSSAERLVSTTSTETAGMTSAALLPIVAAKNTAFRNRQAAFDDLQATTETTVSGVLTEFKALLPVTDFDVQEVTATDEENQIVVLAQDIATRTNLLIADIEERVDGVQAKLDEHDATVVAEARMQALVDGGRLVLGDEFVFVPSFAVPEPHASEWANAYDNREQLLDHQRTTLGNDFPVDDWMSGAARVREKLHHFENLQFLGEALETSVPELRPIQLPYNADAPWMALDYPPEAKDTLARELLLYTAFYPQHFDKTQRQCGLLLDEWTEVVPAETETTGLTFHFNKPSAEPPQVMLLVTPSHFTGAWTWDDLVRTLHDTLDMARLRAVEPEQLDQTALSVFLPATILATTWYPITIAADLSAVNKFASKMS